MEYNVGDKLLCKKDFTWATHRGVMFTKGKSYVLVYSTNPKFQYTLIADDGMNFSFDLVKSLEEVFVNIRKIRKMKLDNLYENK